MSKYDTYDAMFRNLEATVKYVWKGDAFTKHRVLRDFMNQYDPYKTKLQEGSVHILSYLNSIKLTTNEPQSRRTIAVAVAIPNTDLFNKFQQELLRNKFVTLIVSDEIHYLEITRKGVEYVKQYIDVKNP